MFARKVAARLKPNSLVRFTNIMEFDILPWLRTQEGFEGLIILAASDGSEVAAISFWNHRDHAEAYNSNCYPHVLQILGDLLDYAPYVKTFEVVSSTLQKVAPACHLESEIWLSTLNGTILDSGLTQIGKR